MVDVLKKYWGYASFRPLQESIIASIVSGKDTIALLPTGGGKSICFQVPAMMMEGVCLVISPLIALMEDQVNNLKKRGIKATAINSAMNAREMDIALDNAVYGDTRFLYLSPERLHTALFRARLAKMKVSFVAVDEAHCISQWGHDFRPAYRQIAALREELPGIPVMALTATATPEVVTDIGEQLGMRKPAVFQKSFTRSNLVYVVQKEENKLFRLLNIARNVGGSGIVYVGSRKETVRQAHLLQANGVSALPYHAGLDHESRTRTQEAWLRNKARVVVATNAFGMGIDKPDVRFVVHLDVPMSIEAYFQEGGRAGRDERRAYAVMLVNEFDCADTERRVREKVPDPDMIRQVYRALSNHFQLAIGIQHWEPIAFNLVTFSKKYQFDPYRTYHALKLLEMGGYLSLSEAVHSPSQLQMLLKGKDLYSFEVGNPTYTPLLQLVLRSYEGIFDQPVRIKENVLADRLKIPVEKLKQMLLHLAKLKVLRYQMQTQLPFIAFPEQRINPSDLKLRSGLLGEHRDRLVRMVGAMTGYVQNDLVCRSVQLVAYFGENDAAPCGLCDVCLERKKQVDMSDDVFEEIRSALLARLTSGPEDLEVLKESATYNRREVMRVLYWMVDNGTLRVNPDKSLCLGKP